MKELSHNSILLTQDTYQIALQKAVDFLQRGYSVVFPTDTLYALGVNACDDEAVSYLFSLKRRASHKPVSVFVANIDQVQQIADVSDREVNILQHMLPGKFTFVVKQKHRSPLSMHLSPDVSHIGIRIPESDFVSALVNEFGAPITASSANVSGLDPASTATDIFRQFQEHGKRMPDFFIDGGDVEDTTPSTVVDITTSQPKILRMSTTDQDAMQTLLNEIQQISG